MRSIPTILFPLAAAAVTVVGLSGCVYGPQHFGPPPPAYACDGYQPYGYHAFGGYSECVDDGQYHSRRDLRRMRRDGRLGRHARHPGRRGHTLNGLPVVAAYIVPMDMMGDSFGMCGGWECCEGMPCGDGFPCGDCGPCGGGACEIGAYPGGPDVYQDGMHHYPDGMTYPDGMHWESGPSEAYPPSYSPAPGEWDGRMLSPVPVPPAEEGPWNPPSASPSTPRTSPEPEAGLPVEGARWMPSRLP
jgi:hypothetical protein